MAVSRQTINAIETERYTPSLPLAIVFELARGESPTAYVWVLAVGGATYALVLLALRRYS